MLRGFVYQKIASEILAGYLFLMRIVLRNKDRVSGKKKTPAIEFIYDVL